MELKYGYLLPLGTVVKVSGQEHPVMIHGVRFGESGENGAVYDYTAVPWPEGIFSNDVNIVFNHDDVETVLFRGYEGEGNERLDYLVAIEGFEWLKEKQAREAQAAERVK